MELLYFTAVLLMSYCIGSIPFGLLVVRIINGKDIRKVESGRIGGTNAMRAAGAAAGILTALLDGLKGAAGVWLARMILPGNHWAEILTAFVAILGHNASIFLLEKGKDLKLRFRGGAGGATCVGGAFGLWPFSLAILLPMALVVWYGIGYASITTMAIGVLAMIIFAYRAFLGLSPWQYVIYGLLAEILILWALRPNIARLLNGTERLQGWRSKKQLRENQ